MTQFSHRLLLQIPILATPVDTILDILDDFVIRSQQFIIFTPNPEILLEAQRNEKLRTILKRNDLNIPDGEGVSLFLGIPVIKGRVFMHTLLKLFHDHSKKVFIVGSSQVVIDRVLLAMQKKYPGLTAEGLAGPLLDSNALPMNEQNAILQQQVEKQLLGFEPDLILVAFGAPKQEIWTDMMKVKFPKTSFMVVGGALDTYSGIKSLPHHAIVSLKLEWFFRLVQEPKRILRIFRAVVVFPFFVLWERCIHLDSS